MENKKEPAELRESVESLVEDIKSYIRSRYDLMTLDLQERIADVVSSLTTAVVAGLAGLFILLFSSIGVAWLIGQYTGDIAAGFFYVSGFYLLVFIIIILFREKMLRLPLINFMIRKIQINEGN